MGNVSPQNSFAKTGFLAEPVEYSGNRLACVEPDYKTYIDVKQIRRMSRVIRMGVAAAMECLNGSGIAAPEAIITGTAYGCLEDTGIFLGRMVSQREQLLPPTAFIQSTHNTVGAQVALMLQCKCYNNVFVHRALSFETALLDAQLLMAEGGAKNALVGGLDEITDTSHAILSRFGLYRRKPGSNLRLFSSPAKGTIAGEGAAFFLLTADPSPGDHAVLEGLHSFYKPADTGETGKQVLSFLSRHSLSMRDIDIIIWGRNGDTAGDRLYNELATSVFEGVPAANYKHLCGEYPTSMAFALWVAANMVKLNTIPAALGYEGAAPERIRRILVYNHSHHIHHSLLLVSAC
jgi:3-oxoacyl-[acyl-carrier-protein] synthase II